jgi:hypothetical protein
LFQGITEREIDEMMASFRFDNCVRRAELAEALSRFARA